MLGQNKNTKMSARKMPKCQPEKTLKKEICIQDEQSLKIR